MINYHIGNFKWEFFSRIMMLFIVPFRNSFDVNFQFYWFRLDPPWDEFQIPNCGMTFTKVLTDVLKIENYYLAWKTMKHFCKLYLALKYERQYLALRMISATIRTNKNNSKWWRNYRNFPTNFFCAKQTTMMVFVK